MTEKIEQVTTGTNTTPLSEIVIISPLAEEIATQLGETEPGPIRLIQIVIDRLGEKTAREFATAAVKKQAEGGMFLGKLDRKRTTGGIFFFWARIKIGNKEWTKFNPLEKSSKPQPEPQQGPATTGGISRADSAKSSTNNKSKAPSAPLITDASISALYAEAATWSVGSATSTKLTLIGKPDKVKLGGGKATLDNFQYIAITLQMNKVPELPRGLPVSISNTKYLVLVGAKQWRKIKADLGDERNRLMIEAYPTVNEKVVAGIVASASNVTINQAHAKEGKEVPIPVAGVATTTNLLLTGRPGEVKRVKDAYFFTMESDKVPALPAGLPPIGAGTKYLVCVAAKQWRNVADAITRDEEDKLVVDGHLSFDPRWDGVIVSVMSITTTAIQRAKREQQQTGAATNVMASATRELAQKGINEMSDNNQITEQGTEQEDGPTQGILRMLPLDQIDENPEQARTYFDEKALKELADSIKMVGLLEPILVRPVGENRYKIIAGERRYRAVRLNGDKTILAIVKKMDDIDAHLAMTTENLLRDDLDIEDQARDFQYLLTLTGWSQRKLGERLGVDHNYISRRVRMLRRPELLQAYREGKATLHGITTRAEEAENVSQGHTLAQGSLPETPAHSQEDVAETVSRGHTLAQDDLAENTPNYIEESEITIVSPGYNMAQSSQAIPVSHIRETADKIVSPGHKIPQSDIVVMPTNYIQETPDKTVSLGHKPSATDASLDASFLPTMPVGGLIQTPASGSMGNLDNLDAPTLRQMINTDLAQFYNIFDRWSKVFSVMPPAEQLLMLNSIDELKRRSDALKEKLKGK